jgi:hypothetical protein
MIAIPNLARIYKRKQLVLARFDWSNIGNDVWKLVSSQYEYRISGLPNEIKSDVTFSHPANRGSNIGDCIKDGDIGFQRVGYRRESGPENKPWSVGGNKPLRGYRDCSFCSFRANACGLVRAVRKETLDSRYKGKNASEPREDFGVKRDPFIGRLWSDFVSGVYSAMACCLLVWGLSR